MNFSATTLRRWFRSKWVIAGGSALLAYTLGGFFLLPAVIKWQMLKRLPALTKRAVAVRQVKLNPYALSLTIRGFSLTETNGEEFASFGEFYVNFELVSIFKRGFVFSEISIKRPSANIVYRRDGSFNFSNLVSSEAPSPPKPKTKQALPLIMIGQLNIEDGGGSFTDLNRKTPFAQQFGPINIHLSHFTTRPKEGSPYSIVAGTDAGTTFSWAGDISVNPPHSAGTFKLAALQIKTYSPYIQDFARVQIVDGRVNVQADYRFDYAGEALDLDVSKASLDLSNLQIKSGDTGEIIVAIPYFSVKAVEASLANQTARIGSVVTTGGVVQARMNPDGTIDPLALLTVTPTTPAKASVPLPAQPPNEAKKSAAWKLALDEFKLEDYTLKAEDLSRPKPTDLAVENLNLAVDGVAVDLLSNSVQVAAIKLAGFNTVATILPQRGSNAVAAARQEQTTPKPTETTAQQSGPKNNSLVTVGAVVLENTSFHFADESVEPHVTATIDGFGGSVKGLTSDLHTAAAVDFQGKVNGYAPFSISGQINPLAKDLFVDLAILFRDTGLTPISPYMTKYAGYPLEKGTLSLDLHYFVTQRELKAKNNVRVDQLALGPGSNSPDAIKLPIKLAIALLQDRHGVISLDVPVTGSLDDPKFKLGPIIWQVFMNILTKAVTKPFALLGSMFGGGEDLDFIAFEPGRADFAMGEINKLDALAKALYERPALNLVITGAVDPVKDRESLAKARLEHQLKTMRMQELVAAGQRVTSADVILLEPADRERLIKLAYAEAMGLVSSKASPSRQEAVLAHLTARQNFEPFRKAPAAGQAAPGTSGNAVTVADMEQFLVHRTEITADDFRNLTMERAGKVQAYLVQSGKVSVERASVAAPKSVDASYQGQSRVNLSLQ